MKRFSEQFNTKSKSVKLSSSEKKELQERLVSYVEYHPLPAELKSIKKTAVKQKTPLLQEAFTTVSIPFSFLFKTSAVMAAFVLLVVPFMAERTVPGDTLYAVKVQFNEELRGTLTFDSVQKVEWETERLNRRIAEARLLASEGRLTEAVEAEMAHAVRTHTQNAQKEIAILREQDAEGATIASIEFDSTLEAQATSLKEDSDEEVSSTTVKAPNLIADAVDESRALNEQPNASSTPSYAKLMARVELNTTRIYELRDSIDTKDVEVIADVTRRMQDIDRSVAAAIEKSDTDEARDILVDVLKRTQKLIVFITDLEVSQTVDIEELVPVVLTGEEEVLQTNIYKQELSEKQVAIETLLLQASPASDQDFIAKIQSGLDQIAQLSQQMEEAEDFAAVSLLATQAIAIADDALLVLEAENVTQSVSEEVSNTTVNATTTDETDVVIEPGLEVVEAASTTPDVVATSSTSTVVDAQ